MTNPQALEFLKENEANWRRFLTLAPAPQERAIAISMLRSIAALKQEVLNREEASF